MKKFAVLSIVLLTSGIQAKDAVLGSKDKIVDSFRVMRECDEGQIIAKELDGLREKLSKEIEADSQKLVKRQEDLKAKASTMKKELVEKEQRQLAKDQRALEEKIGESENELKVVMQQKTEKLAMKVETSIIDVAKEEGAELVVDGPSGRVLYMKPGSDRDITGNSIAQVNKAMKQELAENKTTKKAAVAA